MVFQALKEHLNILRKKEGDDDSVQDITPDDANNKILPPPEPIPTLDRFLFEAEYEIEHNDPYRIGEQSPWKRCQIGSLTVNDNDVVSKAARCACPSLLAWTREANSRNRKRKRQTIVIGKRPENCVCSCDFNPYCLVSLGGIVDEVLEERIGTEEIKIISNDKYTASTKARLNNLRKSTWVTEQAIRDHLKRTLGNLTSVLPIKQGIDRIRERNAHLIFDNPLDPVDVRNGEMRLSVPPGIENLGATCYLNTQLQCLAQNPIFLEGIFAWESTDPNDRMSKILSLFQQLLARLKEGPYNTVNTLEFSNALGLDHFEQQDPNEFSRLLFERMQESFKATERDKVKVPGSQDLSELLPNLFEGTVTYVTTCMHCKTKSYRDENFMDINLPIVKGARKKGQTSILESLFGSNKVDTDVQHCWDQYCGIEHLNGDNKYHCSNCDTKQDAERAVTFKKLPSILNLQLNRYLFDMEKLEKKKLSDKVLLSNELKIPGSKSESGETSPERRYILCAVMKHKGTSAYRGHYVAEAMDWTTGQWFEFNDTEVKILQDGPSSSDYSVGGAEKENANDSKAKTSISGSEDAYNMYYVDEDFLAQSILDVLKNCKKAKDSTRESAETFDQTKLRSDTYADTRKMCVSDGELLKMLDERKAVVKGTLQSLVSGESDSECHDTEWVDGELLRSFLALDDLRDRLIDCESVNGLMKSSAVACDHGRLHPKVFRKGKLLPRILYESITKRLEAEKGALESDSFYPSKDMKVDLVDPNQGFRCDECSQDYTNDIKQRSAIVRAMKLFLDAVEPSQDASLSFVDENELSKHGESQQHTNERVFVAERKALSSLKSFVSGALKSLHNSESVTSSEPKKLHESPDAQACEGLCSFDLEQFVNLTSADESLKVFNANITCQHGKLSTSNKRSIRFLTSMTWDIVEALLGHMDLTERRLSIERLSSDADQSTIICSTCSKDSEMAVSMKDALVSLGINYRKLRGLSKDVIHKMVMDSDDSINFRLVHSGTVRAWNRFVGFAKGKESLSSPRDVIDRVLDILLLNEDVPMPPSSGNIDRSELQQVYNLIRPLVCPQHEQIVESVISASGKQSDDCMELDDDMCCILDADAATDFLSQSVSIILLIAFLRHNIDISLREFDEKFQQWNGGLEEKAQQFCVEHDIFKLLPSIRWSKSENDSSSKVVITSETSSIPFDTENGFCRDEDCQKHFESWSESSKRVSTDSRTPSVAGSSGKNPICLDGDDGFVDVRLFLVEGDATDEDILKSVSQSSGIPDGSETDAVLRSSRRRRSRLPTGNIEDEQTIRIKLDYNLAALRLTLFERCSGDISQYELNHSLFAIIVPNEITTPNPEQRDSLLVPLPFHKNSQTFEDYIKKETGIDVTLLEVNKDVMLVRKASRDETSTGLDDMESLISVSNAAGNEKKEKPKSANYEKGFRDTFLSKGSISSIDGRVEHKDEKKTEDVIMVVDSPTKKDSKAKAGVIVLDHVDDKPKDKKAMINNSPLEDAKPSWQDDSSDDGAWLHRSAFERVPKRAKVAKDMVVVALSQRLLDNDMVDANEENLVFEAAQWTINENPESALLDDLFDQALAKYLELFCNK